jgi:hypothetical protein
MHPLNDPYTPDDTERFLTFEPDQGKLVFTDSSYVNTEGGDGDGERERELHLFITPPQSLIYCILNQFISL